MLRIARIFALLVAACGPDGMLVTDSPQGAGGAGGSGPIETGGPSVEALKAEISGFTFKATDNPGLGTDVVGVVTGATIALTVPSTATVTALKPAVTFIGATLSPLNDAPQSFSSPVSYRVAAADGSSAEYVVTVTVAPPTPPTCQSTASACSLDVYNRAVAFVASHPKHSSTTSWDGYCGALMMQFGGFGVGAQTALDAYRASTIVSTDPTKAPIGAFHYWNYLADGHVGVDLLGQGAVVFMASSHLGDSWGSYIGVNSVGGYSATTGAGYLGWSMQYNGHGQALSGGGACGAANVPNGCALPKTPTETSGVPDMAFVMLLQRYGADHGYTGPIDGHSDAATWLAVQRALQAQGYTGPVNGLPASNTYSAFQRLAAQYGYTGPINGVLGPNSFRGFARFLNETY